MKVMERMEIEVDIVLIEIVRSLGHFIDSPYKAYSVYLSSFQGFNPGCSVYCRLHVQVVLALINKLDDTPGEDFY